MKKCIITLCVAMMIIGIPTVANASAKYGTPPGSGWALQYADDGIWYTKNKDALVGSNYYSTGYTYSKASVKDGKGNYTRSNWMEYGEAYAARKRTTTGTNKVYYDHKN